MIVLKAKFVSDTFSVFNLHSILKSRTATSITELLKKTNKMHSLKTPLNINENTLQKSKFPIDDTFMSQIQFHAEIRIYRKNKI